ncbi:hypothetical protein TW95_gp1833 [Pandoravirus inopinatum]|uniref:Uncharacterized protein n=1 Tax=Pandoravirus inopinatum TaxID=1605721 RepID=A0A0B5JFD7_9VIRU|nr:hypothetical protein TW95_gp1833 [Pandoravirus inopinatum]AJF98567.1 hypothetical protein [Pandoravirus inopinatum]
MLSWLVVVKGSAMVCGLCAGRRVVARQFVVRKQQCRAAKGEADKGEKKGDTKARGRRSVIVWSSAHPFACPFCPVGRAPRPTSFFFCDAVGAPTSLMLCRCSILCRPAKKKTGTLIGPPFSFFYFSILFSMMRKEQKETKERAAASLWVRGARAVRRQTRHAQKSTSPSVRMLPIAQKGDAPCGPMARQQRLFQVDNNVSQKRRCSSRPLIFCRPTKPPHSL